MQRKPVSQLAITYHILIKIWHFPHCSQILKKDVKSEWLNFALRQPWKCCGGMVPFFMHEMESVLPGGSSCNKNGSQNKTDSALWLGVLCTGKWWPHQKLRASERCEQEGQVVGWERWVCDERRALGRILNHIRSGSEDRKPAKRKTLIPLSILRTPHFCDSVRWTVQEENGLPLPPTPFSAHGFLIPPPHKWVPTLDTCTHQVRCIQRAQHITRSLSLLSITAVSFAIPQSAHVC